MGNSYASLWGGGQMEREVDFLKNKWTNGVSLLWIMLKLEDFRIIREIFRIFLRKSLFMASILPQSAGSC